MKLPHIALSPMARKLIAAAVAVSGVFAVGGQLKGNMARDVEVRGSLREFADASRAVRSVDVTFLRGEMPLRSLRRNYASAAPRELREKLGLPEGELQARVTVTLDGLVVERESSVRVSAGGAVDVPAPSIP